MASTDPKNYFKFERNGLSVVILGACWYNRGDEAALRAMLESIFANFPVKSLHIQFLKNIQNFPYPQIKILPLFSQNQTIFSSCSLLSDHLLLFFPILKRTCTKEMTDLKKSIKNANIVLIAPSGPPIGDIHAGIIDELLYLCRLFFVINNNIPLFFYAPSMGPFNSHSRNIFRKLVLKRVTAIIVRENISKQFLKEQLGLDAYVTADSAAQNTVYEEYLSRYEHALELLHLIKKEKFIGIVLTDLDWHPRHKGAIGMTARIKEIFVDVTSYLINHGYKIILIQHLFGDNLNTSLYSALQNLDPEHISLLDPEYDAYAQQVVISNLYCVIGLRYHSAVFATKYGVPSICICYEHKAKGFMDAVGLSEFAIDIKEISANAIIDKFIYLEKHYEETLNVVNKNKSSLRRNAGATIKIIVHKVKLLGLIKY
jgi:colanic acid/amylovoran biosynthesis protein